MRSDDKQTVRITYGFRCGYCKVRKADVGAELTIDHFQPCAHSGSDDLENLVYCCNACNTFKGDYWQPHSENRLLRPVLNNMDQHLTQLEDGTLLSLTPTGAFHLHRLRLNRPELVRHRAELRQLELDKLERQTIYRELAQIEARLQKLYLDLNILLADVDPDTS